MRRFTSFLRCVINRLQGQAKIVSFICVSNNIVGKVVYLDLFIFFRIKDVVLAVEPQLLLLPHTQTIRSGIRLADDEAFALDDRRREDIECQLDQLLNKCIEVTDELLEGKGLQGRHQVSSQFVLTLLGSKAFDIIFVGMPADEILTIVQPCIQLPEDFQLPSALNMLHKGGDAAQRLPSLRTLHSMIIKLQANRWIEDITKGLWMMISLVNAEKGLWRRLYL